MGPVTRRVGWLLVIAVGLAGCGTDQGIEPADPPDSIRFVAGRTATDTIGAELVQALVVEVPGAPAGTVIRFEAGSPPGGGPAALVAPLGSNGFVRELVDTLETTPRASVRIKLGGDLGIGTVVITVPEYGLRDSASYTITPGRAALVLAAPRDTAVFPGASYRVRWVAYDRAGHEVPDLVDFSAADANVTMVGDLATAGPIGRGRIAARSRSTGVTDTVYLNAVPDGILAAFAPQGLLLFHPNGAVVQQWPTPAGGGAFTADWSPDGQELAADVAVGALRIISLDGTTRFPTSAPNSLELYPDYSSDGRWIYFSRGDTSGFSIHRIRPDGTGDTTIVALSGSDVAPAISPDGRKLVYTVTGPDQLRIYDLVTKASSVLAPKGHTASWSPDGARLAYWNDGDVWVMNADGTGARALVQGQRYDLGLDWSPDGKWIVARSGAIDLIDSQAGGFVRLGFAAGWLGGTWKPR